MTDRKRVFEMFSVLGLSTAVSSLNWTQINGGLTAVLIVCNIIWVVRKIRGRKK